MDDFSQMTLQTTPTAARPLLGLTVLVVEDSRFACEALRLLCLRSGARIRRADCIASAKRHLQVYRPSVILIDLGLPDGSGLDLINELAHVSPRISVILGLSGEDRLENRALKAGADGFIAKPLGNLGVFQQKILAHLPEERHPAGPRIVIDETVCPDRLSYADDLAHAAELIEDKEADIQIGYLAQFVTGIARHAEDYTLAKAGDELARAHRTRQPLEHALGKLTKLISERLNQQLAI